MFQHTAARRRLQHYYSPVTLVVSVSTHSRPKAAATSFPVTQIFEPFCFNTQPPEGGCTIGTSKRVHSNSFNTQPPEGGCCQRNSTAPSALPFQHTAARRRLHSDRAGKFIHLSFNTQPPEGGCLKRLLQSLLDLSFNTQPPEGGCPHLRAR